MTGDETDMRELTGMGIRRSGEAKEAGKVARGRTMEVKLGRVYVQTDCVNPRF